jgi:hypothetical protein
MAALRWASGIVTSVAVLLAAAVGLVLYYHMEATWAVAVATLALVAATLVLGLQTLALTSQTQALARATRELVRVEERRDLRGRLEQALQYATLVRDIAVDGYVDNLERGVLHDGFANRVLELAKYADLVADADTRRSLTQWRNWIDDHRGGRPIAIGANGPQMRKEYADFLDRLQREMTAWRDRLVSL